MKACLKTSKDRTRSGSHCCAASVAVENRTTVRQNVREAHTRTCHATLTPFRLLLLEEGIPRYPACACVWVVACLCVRRRSERFGFVSDPLDGDWCTKGLLLCGSAAPWSNSRPFVLMVSIRLVLYCCQQARHGAKWMDLRVVAEIRRRD